MSPIEACVLPELRLPAAPRTAVIAGMVWRRWVQGLCCPCWPQSWLCFSLDDDGVALSRSLTIGAGVLQEDTAALGGAAPVLYLAGVTGFEVFPLFAPRPVSSISGLAFGVLRLRLWLSLIAGLFFGPLQVRFTRETDQGRSMSSGAIAKP